ncbi:MAG: ABC transporter permease [Deltaproteobacteria bacterium]|nr:ABC transporter permease [Deltaproteobacteria bacterium]
MTTSDITWEKLAPELLQPLQTDGAAAEVISRPALTYLQDSLHRLRQNSLAMISLVVITLVTLAGIVGPWFFPKSAGGVAYENQQNPHDINQGPTRSAPLLVVDDFAPVPEERLDRNYDQQAPLLSAGDLKAPPSVHIDGDATVDGVNLVWQPVVGVSGYALFRVIKTNDQSVSLQDLADGTAERGLGIIEINDPTQYSYYDGLGLDPSEVYQYSIVSFVDDPVTGERYYSQRAATIETKLINTIKLTDAQAIDPAAKVGGTIAGRAHLFGTDALGRDVLARMIQGTRVDMLLALLVPSLCILIGLVFGAFSGLMGGRVDTVCMRIVEIVDNFPDLLIFIILQVAIGKGLLSLVIALTAFSWAGFARIVRGEVLRMRELEFVQASKLLGAPVGRLITHHIGPNLLGLIIIAWSARIPGVIASEAFLSMLGLGLEQPTPSWGNVVFDAARRLQVNPVQFFLPASVLGVTLLCFYLLGDSMRDAFDPKLRGRN